MKVKKSLESEILEAISNEKWHTHLIVISARGDGDELGLSF